jgi:cell division protein FtsW
MLKRYQIDEWLFAASVGLALFGVAMVYSASAAIAAHENGTAYHYVLKQGMWTMIGFAAMFLAMQFDYRLLNQRRVVYGLLLLSIVLLLLVFAFSAVNGARRWIRLPGLSIQPSELSKFSLIIFLAYFLERRINQERSFLFTFVPCMVVTGILAVLVVAEPDLGTAMMLAFISLALCFVAGVRLSFLAMALAPALAAIVGLLLFVPFRFQRLVAFLDPWEDPLGRSYQVVQSLIAVGSGGLYGLGFAEGKQKLLFLPFAHSDFIFAIVGEELGLLGALSILAIFTLFLYRGIVVALNAPDRFGTLLSLGIVLSIIAQALFNISVVLSLVPTKGIPLPFISYGGSSLVPTLFAIGIVLNISQRRGEVIENRDRGLGIRAGFKRLYMPVSQVKNQRPWRARGV